MNTVPGTGTRAYTQNATATTTVTEALVESAYLYNDTEGHDKIYVAQVIQLGDITDLYELRRYYGPRRGPLRGPTVQSFMNQADALRALNGRIRDEVRSGYREVQANEIGLTAGTIVTTGLVPIRRIDSVPAEENQPQTILGTRNGIRFPWALAPIVVGPDQIERTISDDSFFFQAVPVGTLIRVIRRTDHNTTLFQDLDGRELHTFAAEQTRFHSLYNFVGPFVFHAIVTEDGSFFLFDDMTSLLADDHTPAFQHRFHTLLSKSNHFPEKVHVIPTAASTETKRTLLTKMRQNGVRTLWCRNRFSIHRSDDPFATAIQDLPFECIVRIIASPSASNAVGTLGPITVHIRTTENREVSMGVINTFADAVSTRTAAIRLRLSHGHHVFARLQYHHVQNGAFVDSVITEILDGISWHETVTPILYGLDCEAINMVSGA